jgi:acylphosphatase
MTVVKHLLIHGRVQGIGYRYSMLARAVSFGVTGWVRNRRDGSVEAMVAGTPDAVERIIGWARQGPRGASVTEVQVQLAEGRFDSFEQLPSA